MKILVVPRKYIEKMIYKDQSFCNYDWFISIFSSATAVGLKYAKSPLPNRSNVLKLQFDDVTEDPDHLFILFNESHGKKIIDFISMIEDNQKDMIYVHCDAGISRSGAVGYLLNEYFNKYLNDNKEDNEFFIKNNYQIMPNPLVVRVLKKQLFGDQYKGIFINEYRYNEDGEIINHIEYI